MIQQSYYPFSQEINTFPISSSISSISPTSGNTKHQTEPDSGWFSWILLIITLIGLAGVVYWLRERKQPVC